MNDVDSQVNEHTAAGRKPRRRRFAAGDVGVFQSGFSSADSLRGVGMDIVTEILTWASGLPLWEQDAIRRIVRQLSLTEQDENEILAILKKEYGLPDKKGDVPLPKPVSRADFPAPTCPTTNVTLCAMRSLKNVNAIADGQIIEFAEKGVTVIYGENASGKSGYSRVLKRACRARDDQGRILPNVYECAEEAPPAEATLELRIADKDADVHWVDGQPSPEEMSSVAVFDAGCARVYIDEQNEVVYTPYGLDLFPRLVDLCQKMRGRLQGEIGALATDQPEFSGLNGSTSAGRLISGLGADTDIRQVEALGTLSDVERGRIEELKLAVAKLKVEAPEVQAKRLRHIIGRVGRLNTKITSLESSLSDEAVAIFKEAQQDAASAEAAARIASARTLDSEPLAGAGTEAWKIMFLAAKDYSEQYAYPEVGFPVTTTDSRCVLCMQPLDKEAKARLDRFWTFVEDETQKTAAKKRQALTDAEKQIALIDVDLDISEADVIQDLSDIDPVCARTVRTYVEATKPRKVAIAKALKDGKWEVIPALAPSPQESLSHIVTSMGTKAHDLEQTSQAAELLKLDTELSELQARDALSKRKGSVLKYVVGMKWKRFLEACRDNISTTGITGKRTKLMEQVVTSSLKAALQEELRLLGIGHFKIEMEGVGRSGATLVQLALGNLKYTRSQRLSNPERGGATSGCDSLFLGRTQDRLSDLRDRFR